MKAQLIIHTKGRPELTKWIDSSEEVNIGRSLQNIIEVKDRKLSRIHCLIYFEKDGFYLQDNNSTNGTYLNKTLLKEPGRLKHGDVIHIGDTRIQFALKKRSSKAKLPERIDHYKILQKIGGGGIGVVYKAEHETSKKIFAIKVLRPEAVNTTMVARFLKEAKACASFNHPSLVKVFGIGLHDEIPYLAMEYVPGDTLSQLIYQEGPMLPFKALNIALRISEALIYCHGLGIIHRDIKPANILVTKELDVKLVDMGMVKILHESGITMSGETLGTPRYMPVEQIEDASTVDHLADIYSLGATLYHMLAGVPPYNEMRTKHLGELLRYEIEHPPVPVETIIELPKDIADFVARSMERDRKSRIANATLMTKELEKLVKKYSC